MGTEISFLLNGTPRTVSGLSPTTTVLDYLRLVEHASGTKEGCAEGDCGACAVVIADRANGRLRYQAINSCLVFLPEVAGKLLISVEGLAEGDTLHPLQAAMAEHHASQCGFCTPGFVMALFAFQHGGEAADEHTIHEALAGNLCRCTGYRPIVAAAREVAQKPDRFDTDESALLAALATLERDESLSIVQDHVRFHAPASLTELLALREEYPDAHLLAGGTDLALLVTKEFRALDEVISLTRVPELATIELHATSVTIGAAVTYSEALPLFDRYWPSLATLVRRIGSRQIRNLGTIGGNIANASPIGDMPPALIALDATLLLCATDGRREMPIEDYFLDYRRTALRSNEVVEAVRLTLPKDGQLFRSYKVAKRWDQDISAVCGAFDFEIRDGRLEAARVAYGGMAATPRRARHCEQALTGQPWRHDTIDRAVEALHSDFRPISDWRASADYRMQTAASLLRRLWLEQAEPHVPLDLMVL